MSGRHSQILSEVYNAFIQAFVTRWSLFLAFTAVFVASRILKHRRDLHAVGHLPGLRVGSSPTHFTGALTNALFPVASWNPGNQFGWSFQRWLYQKYGNDTISLLPYLFGKPMIITSNLDVLRQVLGGAKSSFGKPSLAQTLGMFGTNVFLAEREAWRRHRRIIGPAFNQKLYQMVWKETIGIYNEMVTVEGWSEKDTVRIPVFQSLTFKLALLVIAKCGFGFNFSWTEPTLANNGSMSIQEALKTLSETHLINVLVPRRMQKLLPIKIFRKTWDASSQVMDFMKAQVKERKEDVRSGAADGHDAFTMLVKANEDEEAKLRLDDSELIGNVYIMLFAGHETTAQTLAAAVAFMAAHPEIQQEVYEDIRSVVGNRGSDPDFDDYPKLGKVLAVFYEALRYFPSAHLLLRVAVEDTLLYIPKPAGQDGLDALPIPKGTEVFVDMIGVQYNSRYFSEPFQFKPSRWYNMKNATNPESGDNEEFTAFSVGPRSCIGRKFASLEAVCYLTCLLRDWRISPLLKDNETLDGWKERVIDGQLMMTLGIKDVPVVLKRRA